MRYFPMFLEMRERAVLLAGGGEQIAQKLRLLARTEAQLTILAPDLNAELATAVAEGRSGHVAQAFDAAAIAAADYVFIGLDDQAMASRIAAAARASGALVNVIDQPDACDMITPAVVDRDPMVVAIGTEGAAPVLARRVKTDLEARLSPRLGPYIAHLQCLRPQIAEAIGSDQRLAFWRWAVGGAPWRRWDAGDEEGARDMLAGAIRSGAAPDTPTNDLTIIEEPAAADLAPQRAVARLQEAALIIHPEPVDGAFLDLARRDAERLATPGCPRAAMAEIEAAIAAAPGPVAIIAPKACGARPDDFPGRGASRISAASATE